MACSGEVFSEKTWVGAEVGGLGRAMAGWGGAMDLAKPAEPSSLLVSVMRRGKREIWRARGGLTFAEAVARRDHSDVDLSLGADEVDLSVDDQALAGILDTDALLADGPSLA